MHSYYAEWDSEENHWVGYTNSWIEFSTHISAATALEIIRTKHQQYLKELE